MNSCFVVSKMTNRAFFDRHAAPGRIGVVGGTHLIDRLIRRSQRHLHANGQWSTWSHTFVFQGRRADGHHWVIESDLKVRRKHIQLGVQESRLEKYHDEKQYGAAAIIDVGLGREQVEKLLARALDHVAAGDRYSLREIVATAWALRHPRWRLRENLLARERAFYCSAFVRHLFAHVGVELVPGIAVKHTTPDEIARTPVPHRRWVLREEVATPSR